MKKRVILVAALALLCLPAVGEAAAFGGELTTTLEAQEVGGRWEAAGQASLRLQLRSGAYPWRLYVDGAAHLTRAGGAWDAAYDLERMYVKASFPAVDFILGRQQISWGVGYAWAPTDLFNPPNPLDPQGRRQGVDAVVANLPAGPLDYWSVVLARRRTTATLPDPPWQLALRRHANTNGVDWDVLAIRQNGMTVLGGDMKLDYGLGWTLEAAYFLPDQGKQRWEGVLGADYSWFDGQLVWRGEYRYTSAGASRHYLFNQLVGQIDMLSSLAASLLTNLADNSALATLAGEALLSDAWRLRASVSASVGEPGGEFTAYARPVARIQAQYNF